VPLEDARRLFDTNYWGMVNGALAALPYLRQNGGALINIGSVVSDRAIPLQGHYSASKHAVKAFTDALRMELEHEGAPVSVTLVKPGSTDTPYTQHARNLMEREPTFPPPVYRPETVAGAVLHCAAHPRRAVTVGGGGRALAMMGVVAPRLTDRVMERSMFEAQQKDERAPSPRRDTLYQPPLGDGRVRGDYDGMVKPTSLYAKASLHPLGALLLAGAALGLALTTGSRRRGARVEVELEDGDRAYHGADRLAGDEVGVRAGELEMRGDDYALRGGTPGYALRGGDYGFRSGADEAH
jgi:hypothetical protein